MHHTVGRNDYGPEESVSIVLGIARFHRDVNGWDDLGYNFLVDRHGQMFEGRAGGMDQAVIGAQVQGFNHVSTGIACLGSFDGEALPSAAVEALAQHHRLEARRARHAGVWSGDRPLPRRVAEPLRSRQRRDPRRRRRTPRRRRDEVARVRLYAGSFPC